MQKYLLYLLVTRVMWHMHSSSHLCVKLLALISTLVLSYAIHF